MTIEKCINEFDVDEVIFEEGSTGRELFVVLDGQVEIAKVDGPNKTVIVTLGKGEFFGEMAVIDGSARSATAIAAAPDTRVMRINHARFVYLVSQQPANSPARLAGVAHCHCGRDEFDMGRPSVEHVAPIAAAWRFAGRRAYIAADRPPAIRLMLRDDLSMQRKMFNARNVPIDGAVW